MTQNLKNIPSGEWRGLFAGLGLKKFAADQVYLWIFQKGAVSFDEMTNLSKDARKILKEHFTLSRLTVADILEDKDGTMKFLFELSDGKYIESVLMPIGKGDPSSASGRLRMTKRNVILNDSEGSPEHKGRVTLCISSQVGCALGCEFCRTAGLGFQRNLTISEILDQVLEVRRSLSLRGQKFVIPERIVIPAKAGIPLALGDPRLRGDDKAPGRDDKIPPCNDTSISNIVFMGMGEPLNNYDNVKAAVETMHDMKGMKIARRRITLSTAGVVPGILRMVEDKMGVKLAVSLNATTDESRAVIMPIAKRYGLKELFDACKKYTPPGSRLRTTFEYVLIGGVNDTIDDAKRLAKLLSTFPSKVNLIPFNPFAGSPFKKPSESTLNMFYKYLFDKGIQVNTRRSRGESIMAACGQLAGRK